MSNSNIDKSSIYESNTYVNKTYYRFDLISECLLDDSLVCDICTCVDRIQFIDNYQCSKCEYKINYKMLYKHRELLYMVHKELNRRNKLNNAIYKYKEFTNNIGKDIMTYIVDEYAKNNYSAEDYEYLTDDNIHKLDTKQLIEKARFDFKYEQL